MIDSCSPSKLDPGLRGDVLDAEISEDLDHQIRSRTHDSALAGPKRRGRTHVAGVALDLPG